MPSKKWRRNKQSSSRPFRRARGVLDPARTILIVTEGKETEPVYFKEVHKRLSLHTVDLVVDKAGMNDPKRLVLRALEEQRKRKLNARNGLLSVKAFDELWIVFDTAPLSTDKLHNGMSYAKANGVKCSHSTPCFEFWLLLHLDFTTALMPECANVIQRLAKKMGKRYSKKHENSMNLIPPLIENIQTAIKNSQQVRQHHTTGSTQFPCNPSTEVDLLISSLIQAVSPAKISGFKKDV